MADYSSFGITDIDKLLGGGLLPGSTYLLEAETGSEEMAFVAAFLAEGLRENSLLETVVLDSPHEEFISRLVAFGVDVKKALDGGSMVIGDLCSQGEFDPEGKGPVWMTGNPNDPSSALRIYYDLGQIVTTKFKSGRYRGVRGVTYSLSSQIMAYGFQTIYKLVKQALGIAKRGEFFSLSVLNPRMFNETIITSFEHLLDGVIALEMKELDDRFQRRIRIKKSPITGFSTKIVSYDIEDSRPHLQKQPD